MSYKDLDFKNPVFMLVATLNFANDLNHVGVNYELTTDGRNQKVDIVCDNKVVAIVNIYKKTNGLVTFTPCGDDVSMGVRLIEDIIAFDAISKAGKQWIHEDYSRVMAHKMNITDWDCIY